MRDAIQKLLDELTAQNDKRTSVFKIQIEKVDKGILFLSGKLLDQNQYNACGSVRM